MCLHFRYVNDYKKTVASLKKDQKEEYPDEDNEHALSWDLGRRISENPLQSYLLMKRLAYDWTLIQEMMYQDEWGCKKYLNCNSLMQNSQLLYYLILALVMYFREHKYASKMPTATDLHGAALGILRLHDIYDLKVPDMVNGSLDGVNSSAHLNGKSIAM